jgi:hypothetical protein
MSSMNISNFNPELLKEGDNSQRENWMKGKGNSIFVRWIPDEMDEEIIHKYFGPLGTISNIEFETEKGNNRKLFIHYSEWVSKSVIQEIAEAYPCSHKMYIHIPSDTCYERYFTIHCYVNTRIVDKDAVISELKAKIESLRDEIHKMKDKLIESYDIIDKLLLDNRKVLHREPQYSGQQIYHYDEAFDANMEECEEEINRWNRSVLRHGLSDRHLK